ncbi:hypothetical protein K501DRAFT_275067 [Backusella circina FSU 941]|nr:hypothetical protein K501DRAFT_275067 [Backusella circina FSU 941]
MSFNLEWLILSLIFDSTVIKVFLISEMIMITSGDRLVLAIKVLLVAVLQIVDIMYCQYIYRTVETNFDSFFTLSTSFEVRLLFLPDVVATNSCTFLNMFTLFFAQISPASILSTFLALKMNKCWPGISGTFWLCFCQRSQELREWGGNFKTSSCIRIGSHFKCAVFEMITVPGTHLTKEKLEADRKVDNVTNRWGGYSGSNLLNQYGYVYTYTKKQDDKALAWYVLAAMENNSEAQQKKKTRTQLIKKSEVILEAEKRNLEKKKHKTKEEIETLEQLKITYKLTDGGEDAWKDVPMLLSEDIKHDKKSVDKAVVNYKDEIKMLKKQIQFLQQEKTTLKYDKIRTLENENSTYRTASLNQIQKLETLIQEKATWEQLLKSKEDIIVSLNRENNLLSVAANQGNQQGTNEMVETLKSLLQAKTNEIELLKQNIRINALKQENRMLKQERTRKQTTVQSTAPFHNSSSSSHIGSSQYDHYDDQNNDINSDTEVSNAEESEDDDDSNYDTPSLKVDKEDKRAYRTKWMSTTTCNSLFGYLISQNRSCIDRTFVMEYALILDERGNYKCDYTPSTCIVNVHIALVLFDNCSRFSGVVSLSIFNKEFAQWWPVPLIIGVLSIITEPFVIRANDVDVRTSKARIRRWRMKRKHITDSGIQDTASEMALKDIFLNCKFESFQDVYSAYELQKSHANVLRNIIVKKIIAADETDNSKVDFCIFSGSSH